MDIQVKSHTGHFSYKCGVKNKNILIHNNFVRESLTIRVKGYSNY